MYHLKNEDGTYILQENEELIALDEVAVPLTYSSKYSDQDTTYSDSYSTQGTEYCRSKYVSLSHLKLESGVYLLQEDGEKIALDETASTTSYTDKYKWYI